MPKLLYIHGFASCGKGQKSTALSRYFGEENVVAPDLPAEPDKAVSLLETLISEEKFDLLAGSSLGGFYAAYFAEKYYLKALLINPSTEPFLTLADYVGEQKRFCDGTLFSFKKVYLKQLERYKSVPHFGNYLVLLQSGDEILDYRKAKTKYARERVIVEYGGNHRFENIEDYLSMIGNFVHGQ